MGALAVVGSLLGMALYAIIFAPLAATLIQLAISRSREYQADETGAHLTGNPYALASALGKLDAYSKRIPMQASPSTAHLFIIQPFLGGMSFGNLFSTHPPLEQRIQLFLFPIHGAPQRHHSIAIRARRDSTSRCAR